MGFVILFKKKKNHIIFKMFCFLFKYLATKGPFYLDGRKINI